MDNNLNNQHDELMKDEHQTVETGDATSHKSDSHHGEHSHCTGHHRSSHSGNHGTHHGSHHSGHHHHRHHSSSKKRKKLTFNPRVMWAVAISLWILLAAFVVIFEITTLPPSADNQNQENNASDILVVEVLNSKGVLIKDAVDQYLLTDMLNTSNANVRPSDFSNGGGRLDAQVPVQLKLSVKEGRAESYKIELADNDRFDHAQVSYANGTDKVYSFEHLYANTEYYYRVTVYTNRGSASQIGSFKTADTPRILSIDGISNVRDIGNWKTDSGKKIKQGLLIRGTELDAAVESGYHLTNEGLVDMLMGLGIKMDMDLRAQTATSKDALGAQVSHKYYDMVMYNGIFTDEGKEKVRTVFADLANPNNYPIYLHCTYGCDRTGTICYLLEALLGVSRGDCLKDYGLSNLYIENILTVENGLKAYEGDTLKAQVESYLLSCGVSEYQINSIRNIFLGDE